MAAEIHETYKSRAGTEGDNPTDVILYVVTGTFDVDEVTALIESTAPALYHGLVLSDYDWRPLGNGLWEVVVNYGLKKNTGDVTQSFDTTGGSIHITKSLRTVASYKATGETLDPPDFHGAIGVDGGTIKGCEFPPASFFNFTLQKKWPVGPITNAYILAIADLTLCVNDSAFYFAPEGSLLFRGATGGQTGREHWLITYQFSYIRNETALDVDNFPPIDKKGYEYLWFLYAHKDDPTSKRSVRRAIAAYVEQVGTLADLGGLLI